MAIQHLNKINSNLQIFVKSVYDRPKILSVITGVTIGSLLELPQGPVEQNYFDLNFRSQVNEWSSKVNELSMIDIALAKQAAQSIYMMRVSILYPKLDMAFSQCECVLDYLLQVNRYASDELLGLLNNSGEVINSNISLMAKFLKDEKFGE